MQDTHTAAAGQSPWQVRSPAVKKSKEEKWGGDKRGGTNRCRVRGTGAGLVPLLRVHSAVFQDF